MSIRHLRTLLAIVERGSFAAAARDIHLTESAVSMQMKALEEELGLALFDRSKRPPALTEAGRALLPEAKELVGGYERLTRRKDDAPPVAGHLRLGAVPSAITGILPGALAAMRRKHPGVHVEIAMALSAELVERVSRRRLDAAVVSELGKVPAGLRWSPFGREPLVLIAPTNAPDRPAGDLLASYPFIRYSRQAWVGRLIHATMKRRRIKVTEAMTLDTLEAVTAMVSRGLGVSIVPDRGAGVSFAFPVRTIALPGPTVHRVIGLLRPTDHAKASLTEALFAELANLSTHDAMGRRRASSKKLKK
jgi:DNA-binding transcriptional LysR family regulator